ncbi:extracellular solute-binding protein [Paenibacillus daejeonensis]|uniref:extracellular solute-binding protein n=1 Tax=Paenibacillus daejeonensis TaxID=135193 RepID=UPI00037326F1|nr:extracellular solute-binding protein [Paenibacillus daejeonensis]
MKKKIASSLLSFTLAASLLTACAGNNEPNAPQTPAEGGEGAGSDEIVELDLFIHHSWYPVQSWRGTIADELTKRTGVKLNVTVASDDQQLPLMIASGDLPDLIFANRETRLENEDLAYPWNELIEQYAPDFVIDPTRLAVNTAQDGNVYSVMNSYATPEEWESNPFALGNDGNPGIAVREDIMEALGNPAIESLEDFENILDQVKAEYPDMVPLTIDINWIYHYFQMQFGMPPHSNWYEDGGTLHHKLKHPAMLEYYKFMNNMYRKGHILAENFTYGNDQIDDEYAQSGRAFAHMHTVSVAERNNAALAAQGEEFRFRMIPSTLTDKAINISSSTGFSGVYITRNNSNPEKSIQFLEYLASDEGKELVMFGIEGEQWEWHEDGYPVFTYDVNDEEYVNNEGLKWWYLYSDAIVEGLRAYVPGLQSTQALEEIKAVTEFSPAIGMVRLRSGTDERVIFDRIEEMRKNEEVKIYLATSEEAAEQAYHNMMKLADGIGIDRLEAYADEQYQKNLQEIE